MPSTPAAGGPHVPWAAADSPPAEPGGPEAQRRPILTTHTGTSASAASTPSSIRGRRTHRSRGVRHARARAVRKSWQAIDAGFDIVNDGERASRSTYVLHRPTAFSGRSVAARRADWADFPKPRRARRRSCPRPLATGRSTGHREAVQKDVATSPRLQACSRPLRSDAASPGVIAHSSRTEHYPSREANPPGS